MDNLKNEQLENAVKKVYDKGFNIYALLGRFKNVSKLSVPIPDEVIIAICTQFIKYEGRIMNQWPWFLRVLEEESRKYFAQQEMKEHQRIKNEPLVMKDIFKILGNQ